MKKLVKRSLKQKCFARIYKVKNKRGYSIHARFNVFASEFLENSRYADILFDEKNIFINPNKNGCYTITWDGRAGIMCFNALINNIGSLDFTKRYCVEKCEKGIKICLEKER